MSWDKEARVVKIQPIVNKLVVYLKTKGIEFSATDTDELENVVLTSKDKVVKISHRSFYRYSGMAFIYKDKGENEIEAIELSDEMFMDVVIKPAIDALFKPKK